MRTSSQSGSRYEEGFTLDKSTGGRAEWLLTQEAFDQLLLWLDSDRESAGRKYEEIRTRLIKLFTCRGCPDAADLADESINRVIKKLGQIIHSYEGNPALYFFGVANNVHHEYLRKQLTQRQQPIVTAASDETEANYECLIRCMETLLPENRDLVLQYYQLERKAKIEHRKALAGRLGIGVNALRIRAHRIRTTLADCVKHCVDSGQSETI